MSHDGQSIRGWMLGIVGTVIAGLLLTGLNYCIPSVWEFTRAAALWIYGTATLPVSVPLWLLCSIGIFFVPTLHQIWKSIRGPNWRQYTADEFESVRWRWRYSGGQITDLWCYCPHDDTKLAYSEEGGEWQGWRLFLHCDTCQRQVGSIDRRIRDVIASIEKTNRSEDSEWRMETEGSSITDVKKCLFDSTN